MTRTLVVTADDVGLHSGTTLGAARAHERGIVTACSVMAAGPDFPHAVDVLRANRSLAVGVHLTLVEGRPISPPSEVASLVTAGGEFPPTAAAFLRRYAAGRVDPEHVELELRRQIEAVAETGLEVSHANSHQHLHVLPGVLDVVARLCVEHGIAFVRAPVDLLPRGVALGRSVAVRGLGILGRRARWKLRACGLATPDATVGIARAGHLTADGILELLARAEGVTELVCHPGIGGSDLAGRFAWGYDWDGETAALCDPRVRQGVRDTGLELTAPTAFGRPTQE